MKCRSNDPNVREKTKQTCMERYGKSNAGMCKEFQEKRKKTMKERYNVEYTGQSKELMQKVANTNIKKYGGIAPMCSEEIKNKSKQTCIDKFGFENNKLVYLWENILSWKDYIIPLFNKKDFRGRFDKKNNFINYKWKCVKCGNEFESRIYSTKHLIYLGKNFRRCARCENCFPYINTGTSKLEQELINYIKKIGFSILPHNFEIISPYELDIVIPTYKIALEFNGSYYHSINKKPLGYHLMKTELARKAGYRLIHIWEDEWLNRKINRFRK